MKSLPSIETPSGGEPARVESRYCTVCRGDLWFPGTRTYVRHPKCEAQAARLAYVRSLPECPTEDCPECFRLLREDHETRMVLCPGPVPIAEDEFFGCRSSYAFLGGGWRMFGRSI